ncbi:HD domain-containing protein [Clostridium magnum]|uniref:Guanosine-5'-triphosphate,3'-diphosphate pyrophosphatase n=1 Tax=Clostridium magnum DSM 2767 TaxID=1121326 RepID=A0A162RTE6_9CLOT|nr:HD domain-containing protein [Clostridium magnum]KZL90351.1 guanosine-5'-triphosphate,3'-diphosphate pyrophosphatase [Clostridium magnum DSM 2767]SHH82795.1 exopolyphosphatase / guanosine-5'-triphosphate,3'-diphosphate pyrophosphatase [Clostridium magnum DSM 2767]
MLNVHSYLSENEVLKIIEKYNVHNILLHEKKVASYAVELFDFINQDYKFSTEDRDFLKYSALLHDIGYFIHKEKHHKHTKYIILKEPILNKLPAETRVLLAAAASSHGKSIDKSIELCSNELKVKLLKLIALLRMADALDHTHNLNVSLEGIKVKNETFKIKISGQGSQYVLKKLKKKSDLFSKVYGMPVSVKCS